MGAISYRHDLPQIREVLLADGGLETTLVFDRGIELTHFAAFPLLDENVGRAALIDYFVSYIEIARRVGAGIVLETPTWRANRDWGALLGYDENALDTSNRAAVAMLEELRGASPDVTIVISGLVGPRGDGYQPGQQMTAVEAEAYHRAQIATFADTAVDLTTLLTANYVDEAIGFARAGRSVGLPVVVSFTVETDGTLPTGEQLGDAVNAVDEATDAAPVFYGINCAHPDHFVEVLTSGDDWVGRVGLIRANASRMSHAELDEAEELDSGDPDELAAAYVSLRRDHPGIRVIGGCCGTDHRHVGAIADACLRI